MAGNNIGDLLSKAHVTLGWFSGGFDLSITNPNGTNGCQRSTSSVSGKTVPDYSPHHEPFQYYASTANPTHARPAPVKSIAHDGEGVDDANKHAQGRCGSGPRLPMLAVSPWAKENTVDHSLTNQVSIIRFVEDHWLHGKRLDKGSFDAISNSITGMFDFQRAPRIDKLFLDETTGEIKVSD